MARAQPSFLQQGAPGSCLGTVFQHTSSTGTFAIKLIISALHAKDFEVQARCLLSSVPFYTWPDLFMCYMF